MLQDQEMTSQLAGMILHQACEMMLNKQIIKGQQYPSLGCNIKWHPWNSPEERA